MLKDLPKIGEVREGWVTDFGMCGEGVLKENGFAVFCDGAIKGECVRYRITHVTKNCAFADLIEVLSVSNDRIKPKCPYFGRCGGCSLQHLSYSKQLEIKKQNVVNALKKVGGIVCDVDETVSLNEWEYRNKLALPFGYRQKTKRVVLGFYEKKSHSVVPMKWCPLHGEWCSHLIADVCEWANENGISVYDENTGKGVLRHLVARMLDTLTVTLVLNAQRVENLPFLVQKLDRHFSDYTIFVSPNLKKSNAIMGADARLVYGKERAQDLGKFKAVVSPLSFLQVNNAVRDRIYDDVCANLADFDGDIIELYSGVGLLTAQIAARLKTARITSVEIVPSAVENAKALMKSLSFDGKVECVCDDALNFVASLAKSKAEKTQNKTRLPKEILQSPYYLGENISDSANRNRALILDPPRKGCDGGVLQAVKESGFEKIIYVSCNPQTLARDLKTLCDTYEIKSVTPYDMFAQTSHVETLVVLRKKSEHNA